MNKFTFLSCLVFLIALKSEAQQQTTEPVRNKSNRIILHYKDTTGLFTQLAKDLIDRGYELVTRDRELGIVKTNKTDQPGGWSFQNEIKAVFRDSTITISDVMYSSNLKIDLFYVTKKYIIHYKAWNHVMEIANSMKPDHISYMEVK
jgi:hypothetical protein